MFYHHYYHYHFLSIVFLITQPQGSSSAVVNIRSIFLPRKGDKLFNILMRQKVIYIKTLPQTTCLYQLTPPHQEKKVVLLVLVQNLAARGLARNIISLICKAHRKNTKKNNNTFFILNTSFFSIFFLLLHVAQTNQLNIIFIIISNNRFHPFSSVFLLL